VREFETRLPEAKVLDPVPGQLYQV
jgi:hypothetical protein